MNNQQQYDDFELDGTTWKSEPRQSFRAFTIPDGVSLFEPVIRQQPYLLDILAYRVGEGNRSAAPGKIWWERRYHVHQSVGPRRQDIICAAETFGQSCAICDWRNAVYNNLRNAEGKNPLKQIWDRWKRKHNMLCQLIDASTDESYNQGVQLFDYSYSKFGENLLEHLREEGDESPHWHFARLAKGGYTIQCKFIEQTKPGFQPWRAAKRFSFTPRQDYGWEFLSNTYCLDDLLIVPVYDEVHELVAEVVRNISQQQQVEEDSPPPSRRFPPAGRRPIASPVPEEPNDQPPAPRRLPPPVVTPPVSTTPPRFRVSTSAAPAPVTAPAPAPRRLPPPVVTTPPAPTPRRPSVTPVPSPATPAPPARDSRVAPATQSFVEYALDVGSFWISPTGEEWEVIGMDDTGKFALIESVEGQQGEISADEILAGWTRSVTGLPEGQTENQVATDDGDEQEIPAPLPRPRNR